MVSGYCLKGAFLRYARSKSPIIAIAMLHEALSIVIVQFAGIVAARIYSRESVVGAISYCSFGISYSAIARLLLVLSIFICFACCLGAVV